MKRRPWARHATLIASCVLLLLATHPELRALTLALDAVGLDVVLWFLAARLRLPLALWRPAALDLARRTCPVVSAVLRGAVRVMAAALQPARLLAVAGACGLTLVLVRCHCGPAQPPARG